MSSIECTAEVEPTEREPDAAELETTAIPAPPKGLMVATAIFCLLGLAVSVQLTRIHLFVHTDPAYQSVCAVSEGVNCETVAISPYSVFAGLPVSVWGIAAYLVMAVLAVWAASHRRLHSAWPLGILLALSTIALGTSAVLAYISATQIDSFCLFCMGSYVVNACLFVLCVICARRLHRGLFRLLRRDLSAMSSRPILALFLVVAGVGSMGLVHASVPTYWSPPGWTELPALATGTDDDGHHWVGAEDPMLTIVEFSDYECPHCRAAHREIRMLAGSYPDRVRLIHRHYPLDQACHPRLRRPFHKRACFFAQAAECAGQQGQFWQMNDALFSIQEETPSKNVDPLELAVRLGLDRSRFEGCLETEETAERIDRDMDAALERHLRGTPSFVIGERVFMGRLHEPQLERLLHAATPSPR